MTRSILIIGGTQFVGRHIAQRALDRGHRVTLFTRGQTNAGLFAQTEHLRGDRKHDLTALGTREWDAVIDTCGYTPREVAFTAQALSQRTQRYLFVSSVSVYASFAQPNDESSATGVIDDPDTDVIDGRTYGPLKALCEREVHASFGDRALILRPGLVAGPWDATDRFTYWVVRMLRGGPVAAPGAPDYVIQYIDAADLSAFAIDCIEHDMSGTFNVVTPPGRDTLGALLAAACRAANTSPDIVWLPASFLQQQGVQGWRDMPLWLSPGPQPDLGDTRALMHTSAGRAQAHGLRCRPIEDTVQSILQWWLAQPEPRRAQLKAGLSAEREHALLAAWRSAQHT
ncbi:MAG: NAD-dependent epimerase/dehydratase family protein [Betaproteobacteria bacterium]|nr:NAD-dependent epimerase/dehydratase family protein [Betaproteobacteria bacterium]